MVLQSEIKFFLTVTVLHILIPLSACDLERPETWVYKEYYSNYSSSYNCS
jgi:hypothetical protein